MPVTNPASISVAAYRAAAEELWRIPSNDDDLPTGYAPVGPEEKARRRKAWNRIMDAAQELIAESDNPDGAFAFLDDVGTVVLGFELARQGAQVDAAVAHKTKRYADVLISAMTAAQEALVARAGRA